MGRQARSSRPLPSTGVMGPNCAPSTYTACPPMVAARWEPGPEMRVTTGDRYAVASAEKALACPPTVTAHRCPAPMPGAETQVSPVWGVVTVHGAVNSSPSDTPISLVYDAAMPGVPAGPKLVPVTTTAPPPSVAMRESVELTRTCAMAGLAYRTGEAANRGLCCVVTTMRNAMSRP